MCPWKNWSHVKVSVICSWGKEDDCKFWPYQPSEFTVAQVPMALPSGLAVSLSQLLETLMLTSLNCISLPVLALIHSRPGPSEHRCNQWMVCAGIRKHTTSTSNSEPIWRAILPSDWISDEVFCCNYSNFLSVYSCLLHFFTRIYAKNINIQ